MFNHERRRTVLIVVLVVVVGVPLLGTSYYLQSTEVPDLVYRCQKKGTQFVDEMRSRDRDNGVPLDERAYTYRSHYNFAKHRCFVRTDTRKVTSDGVKVTSINQIWDVEARVGAPPFAVESRSFSGFDELTSYQDSPDRPMNMRVEEWFKSLMTQ
jgi:hypothetical protein